MKHKANTHISNAITKLVFAITLTLTLLYSIFVLGYSWVIEDNIFNRLVAQQASSIKHNYHMTGKIDVSDKQIYQLFKGWQQVPTEIREIVKSEPNRVEYRLADGKTYHLTRFYLGDNEYVLLADVARFEVSRDYFKGVLVWLVGFSVIACCLVALLGWRMGRKIAKPLELLAYTVKKLEKGGEAAFQQSIKHMPNNEVGQLADAIEHSFKQLNDALARERDFTKDISHEIRTPISVLQNALSLGSDSATLAEQQSDEIYFSEQAVKQMRSATQKLTQTTDVLLALARNESSIAQSVSLNRLIEDCVLNHFALNHSQKGLSLELEIDMPNDEVMIIANRNLLEILVNNLLSNVVAHASEKDVQLRISKSSIRMTNYFAHPLPLNLTSSGSKAANSTGIGQGLSLIERICTACGWTMHVEIDTEQQHFSVVINLK
ncbi:histidine kinase dimerization/phospho-acceptor domain-containing protein [Pseudoalteromonas sp. SSMSWG5]|uniref:sensor histidine kinase n=1 Tax=Pseudoalteromonas sp. SSMSWG5 TaxID=3139396 RepID=UPI003BADABD8